MKNLIHREEFRAWDFTRHLHGERPRTRTPREIRRSKPSGRPAGHFHMPFAERRDRARRQQAGGSAP